MKFCKITVYHSELTSAFTLNLSLKMNLCWTYIAELLLTQKCNITSSSLQLSHASAAVSALIDLWMSCGDVLSFSSAEGKESHWGKNLGLTPGIFHAINWRAEHVKVQSFDLVTEHHFPGSSSNELLKCSDCSEPMMRCWRQLENHEAMSQSLECIKTKVCPSPH